LYKRFIKSKILKRQNKQQVALPTESNKLPQTRNYIKCHDPLKKTNHGLYRSSPATPTTTAHSAPFAITARSAPLLKVGRAVVGGLMTVVFVVELQNWQGITGTTGGAGGAGGPGGGGGGEDGLATGALETGKAETIG
jgi:hypothetical protein